MYDSPLVLRYTIKNKSADLFVGFIDLLLLLMDVAQGDSLDIHLGMSEASSDSAWRNVDRVRDAGKGVAGDIRCHVYRHIERLQLPIVSLLEPFERPLVEDAEQMVI